MARSVKWLSIPCEIASTAVTVETTIAMSWKCSDRMHGSDVNRSRIRCTPASRAVKGPSSAHGMMRRPVTTCAAASSTAAAPSQG